MILPLLLALVVSCVDPSKHRDSGGQPDSQPSESTSESVGDSTPTDTACTPSVVVYDDVDGDGYGVWKTRRTVCALGTGEALVGGDCDDSRTSIHPGLPEDCETWADDDCDGWSGSDGCMGMAFWTQVGQFDWVAGSPDLDAMAGMSLIGIYGTELCAYGGTLVASVDPAPACPDCVWTFASTVAFEDPWMDPACSSLEDPPGGRPPYWLNSDWGFTYTRPETGEVGAGWLVEYYDARSEWWTLAGPDFAYTDYAFSSDGVEASFYWSATMYDLRYDYWRYGEPTRAYNP